MERLKRWLKKWFQKQDWFQQEVKKEIIKESKNKWNGTTISSGKDKAYLYCCAKPSSGAEVVLMFSTKQKKYIIFGKHKDKKRTNLCFFGGNTEAFTPDETKEQKKKADIEFQGVVPSTFITANRELKEETGLKNNILNKKTMPLKVEINDKQYDIIRICSRSSQLVCGPNRIMEATAYLINLGEFDNIEKFQRTFPLMNAGDDMENIYLVSLENIIYNKEVELPKDMEMHQPDSGKTCISVKPEFVLKSTTKDISEVSQNVQYVDWDKINVLNNAVAEYYAQAIEEIQKIKSNKPVECENTQSGGVVKLATILSQLQKMYTHNQPSIYTRIKIILENSNQQYYGALLCLGKKFNKEINLLIENLKTIENKKHKHSFSF
jgi:8-oxo-dGTP pyrophosphatase MutT (NUDIX family)